MRINLNNPNQYTKENVRQLIALGDDGEYNQLRVSKSGILYLSQDVGAENVGNVAFRMETWCPGNGYVGPTAAQDDEYVERIFNAIKENWLEPDAYIDVF